MNDWIEWSGGHCPVGSSVMVDVRIGANHPVVDSGEADIWLWEHEPEAVAGDYQVTAYRITA